MSEKDKIIEELERILGIRLPIVSSDKIQVSVDDLVWVFECGQENNE